MKTYAKHKLDALRRRVNELTAMSAGLSRSIMERGDERDRIAAHLSRVQEGTPSHIFDDKYRRQPRPLSKQEIGLQDKLKNLDKDIAALRDSQQKIAAQLAPTRALLTRCEEFVKTHRLEPDYGTLDSSDHQHVA
ncbi:MAG: hypothetical protein R3F53_05370 [Gammaproteobacteria bacterium]